MAIFSWTGCYVGGYVGGAWANHRRTTARDLNPYNPPQAHTWDYDLDNSFIGGGTIGCNYQVDSRWVIGLEGEVGSLRICGSAPDPISPALDTVASARLGDWYGVIAARFGIAWDRLLVYGKAGVSVLDAETSVVDTCTTGACGVLSMNAVRSDTYWGWAAGGGLEYAVTDYLSVKGEYLYLGTHGSQTACGVPPQNAALRFCWNHELPGIYTAKLGLNFKFGWAPVVVAKN